MRYFLENEQIKVEIESFGGELKSVFSKAGCREYMWYANPAFWGRTSPVLFPIVGSLVEKKFTWDGKKYPMGQHGFARDMEHKLVSKSDDEIWFELKSTEETLAKFPFEFVLNLGYRLTERTVEVLWKVTNPADSKLYFSIGAHPAFLCPVHGEKNKAGYYLKFDGVSEIRHHGNTAGAGLAMHEDLVLPLTNGKVRITEDFFDRCTYMIEGNQTKAVTLEDGDEKPIVRVDFDTPLFAIWSPEKKNAPFVCIEPWFGRSDWEDFEGDFSQREYVEKLESGEVFEASYRMTFFE